MVPDVIFPHKSSIGDPAPSKTPVMSFKSQAAIIPHSAEPLEAHSGEKLEHLPSRCVRVSPNSEMHKEKMKSESKF
jgi:hypothetical protein